MAALAISSVLPKGENHERDSVFAVIGVTALSTIAGMETSLKAMADVGGRAIGLIVAETVFLALLVPAIMLRKL